jgi:exodeoxyribonuclease V beta subunit
VVTPPSADAHYRGISADRSGWQTRAIERVLTRDWRVTSFSALASQSPETADVTAAVPVGNASEDVAGNVTALSGIAAFPRGTRAGHFFHELLEHLDFPQARGALLEHVIRQQCLRHDIAEHWVDVVANAITDVLDTPLADGLLLRDLTLDRRSNECEFYYPLANLCARELERAVPGLASHDANSPRFTFSLNGGTVSGLMHGYIDLVFEHRGRWFVADWKTNWLGASPADYGAAALQQAMRHHAYDLQYWVYTVALHRHLQQKLGTRYNYDDHVGGVYYFFVRGMRPENGTRSGVFFERPSRAQVEALDALLRGGGV